MKKYDKKFHLIWILAAIACLCALSAFAANSLGKPADESEVPGNWTADHSSTRYLWFSIRDSKNVKQEKALTYYSPEVSKHFPDPDLSEFGDHPDFTNGMNDGHDDPRATVKILTNNQMNDYLESLPKDNMSIVYMGDYPKGLRMPYLVFSKPKIDHPTGDKLRELDKPIYYLRAQVHGNEIAATDGAILLAQRLAKKHPDMDGVLDKISIVILPRFNADGTKLHQRGTSLVSGDSWGTGAPDFLVSQGEGGGVSEYGGGIMAGLDQNRDNLWLGTPASRANARILAEYKPEVCLDAHEYGSNGYFGLPSMDVNPIDPRDFEYVVDPVTGNIVLRDSYPGTLSYYKEQMTTQWGNNLLIPENMRNTSEKMQQEVVAGLGNESNPTGAFYWAPYVEGSYGLVMSADTPSLAVGGLISLDAIPEGAQREKMRKWVDRNGNVPERKAFNVSTEGGFDPGTARNTMGLTPAISFLTESRSPGGRWELPRRVMGQYLTSRYLIKSIIDNIDVIKNEVALARKAVINDVGDNSKKIAIRQDYATLDYSMVETYGIYLDDGSSMDIPGMRRNSRFGTTPAFEVVRPYAYIMDGDYNMSDKIAFRMSHFGIKFERLTKPTEIEVSAYTVTNTRAAAPSFGSSCRIDGVSSATITKTFPTGSYIFYMDQQMANIIAALFEPVSMRSWIGKDLANMNVVLNKEVPFYRYEKNAGIANAIKVEIPILDFTDVFLFDVETYALGELDEARSEVHDDVYGQTMILYGNPILTKTFRAYLPFDGITRRWYVYDPAKESYSMKSFGYDDEMNRYYIEVETASLTSRGDGYYALDVLATPAGANPYWDGGGSSCNGGFAGLALLAIPIALAFKRRKR